MARSTAAGRCRKAPGVCLDVTIDPGYDATRARTFSRRFHPETVA